MKPLLAVAAICLLGACLYPRSPHDLVFTARGEGHSVRLDEGRAYGPDIEVDRFEDGYRGVWNGRTIDVRVAGDRVQGSLGSMPVDLHFEEANGVLAVKEIGRASCRERVYLGV